MRNLLREFLKELILPSFWLFFFIASSDNSEGNVNTIKKADNPEVTKIISQSSIPNNRYKK